MEVCEESVLILLPNPRIYIFFPTVSFYLLVFHYLISPCFKKLSPYFYFSLLPQSLSNFLNKLFIWPILTYTPFSYLPLSPN